jgi:hypothetical protein
MEKWAQLPPAGAPALIFDRLTIAGVTHILINDNIPRDDQWNRTNTIVTTAFLDQFARLDFSRRNVRIYSIRSTPLENVAEPSPNLLLNAGFEGQSSQQLPENWYSYGNVLIDRSGVQAHTGLIAVLATRADGYYQRLGIVSGGSYTLSHWTRADLPNQFARLQINWLDDNLAIIDVSIMVIPVSSEWTRHRMPVLAPRNATIAQIYASVHENSQVWFDDFEFTDSVRK